jgi:acetyl esterase/lipase
MNITIRLILITFVSLAANISDAKGLPLKETRLIGKRYVEAWESGNIDELKKLYLHPENITQGAFNRYRSHVFDKIEFDKIKYDHILLEVTYKNRPGGFDPDGNHFTRSLLLTPEGKIKYDDIFIKHPIAIAMISTSDIRSYADFIQQPGFKQSRAYQDITASAKRLFYNLENTGIPLFGLDLDNPPKEIDDSLDEIESWIKPARGPYAVKRTIFMPRTYIPRRSPGTFDHKIHLRNMKMIRRNKINKSARQSTILGCILLISCVVIAEESTRELLWKEGAPGAKGNDSAKDKPAITIYSPATDIMNGTAVIICPGGGYGGLAMGHEGHEIAKWLNSMGVTGVILEYRMSRGGYLHPIPLQDAQRAIRTVRSRAKALKLDPTRIGIMGFSAGGHLASTTGTHFDAGNPNAEDPIDQVSCRPDFMILCYPVIAFGEPYTHEGSQRNLIGLNPSDELISSLSNEKQVTKDTPPALLFHTDEDEGVPAENSVAFYLALRKANVPAELHIYRKGRHGLGLAQNVPGTADWPNACKQWLQGQELLNKVSLTNN